MAIEVTVWTFVGILVGLHLLEEWLHSRSCCE